MALAVLEALDDLLEIVAVHLQHDVGVHLDEAAVAVIGEALVAGGLRQRLYRFVVEAQVQHRIHHARHRGARARTHRDQQRIGRVAKHAIRLAPHRRYGFGDRRLQVGRVGLAMGVIERADFRRDREARRHRQAQRGHFGEIGALAAQQVAHFATSFGLLRPEGIDPLRHAKLQRKTKASPTRAQTISERRPAGAVKQQIDAQKRAQHIKARHRPVRHNGEAQQKRHRRP